MHPFSLVYRRLKTPFIKIKSKNYIESSSLGIACSTLPLCHIWVTNLAREPVIIQKREWRFQIKYLLERFGGSLKQMARLFQESRCEISVEVNFFLNLGTVKWKKRKILPLNLIGILNNGFQRMEDQHLRNWAMNYKSNSLSWTNKKDKKEPPLLHGARTSTKTVPPLC